MKQSVEPCRSRQCTRLSRVVAKVSRFESYKSRLKGENSELQELIKQNTAAMNQMVNLVQQQQQQQQPSSEPKRNGRGLGLNAGRATDLRFRLCFKCHKKGHFMTDCKQTSVGSGNKS